MAQVLCDVCRKVSCKEGPGRSAIDGLVQKFGSTGYATGQSQMFLFHRVLSQVFCADKHIIPFGLRMYKKKKVRHLNLSFSFVVPVCSGSKARLVRKVGNLTAICEAIV
jgi:hypothetical protein